MDLEYVLDEEGKKMAQLNKWPKKAKIIIIILISTIILLILGFILFAILKQDEIDNIKNKDDNKNNNNYTTEYTIIYKNLTYTENKIINSFKKEGINYKQGMEEINNGNDYEKTDRNIYDLFIPYSAIQKKDKNNYIILYIHSGGWMLGSKEEGGLFSNLFTSKGYIYASMGYTLLTEQYKEYGANIFRIHDEITSCIQSIKNVLNIEGFNIEKLEMAISGSSAGAHLSLFYGYSMKEPSIPIKFILDFSGPVALKPELFIKIKDNSEPIKNLNKYDLENAKKNNLTEEIEDKRMILIYMNGFYGNKFSSEDLDKMLLENKKIDQNNENYKKMIKTIEFAFPTNYIKSDSIPAICVYGGKDEVIGIGHFPYLISINEEYNKKIYLYYSKYGLHNIFQINNKINTDLMAELNNQIQNFSKLYFTSF